MNWAVWGPVLGVNGAALLALIGALVQTLKSHHATLQQIEVTKKQSAAAVTQADAALEVARANTKTAEATAAAAIQDAITKAIASNDQHWALYLDAGQKRIEQLEKDIAKNASRIDAAELKAEAAQVRADRSEHLYSIAIIYMRRLIRWIDKTVPDEGYPPIPTELQMDL